MPRPCPVPSVRVPFAQRPQPPPDPSAFPDPFEPDAALEDFLQRATQLDPSPTDDPDFAEHFVERGTRMVARDRNHPCVIVWSLGNESGWGENHRSMASAIRELDDSRPLAYHPAEHDPLVDVLDADDANDDEEREDASVTGG